MLNELFYFILVLIGIPIGLFLAWVAKDELKDWRKRFYILSILALLISLYLLFTNFPLKIPFILGLIFIVVVFSVLIIQSKK